MSLGFVFAPGWGCGENFFSLLQSHFADYPCLFFNRPYFNINKEDFVLPYGEWIGIGHSFGLARLLSLRELKGFVSIAGFSRFCSQIKNQNGTPLRVIERMIKNLYVEPIKVLDEFYQRCDLSFSSPSFININSLIEDLRIMSENDYCFQLSSIKKPFLSLKAQNDQIVSSALTKEMEVYLHHLTSKSCLNGGHGLGFNEADWCAVQIKNWMNNVLS